MDQPMHGLRWPSRHFSTKEPQAFWARNFDRDLVCTNDAPKPETHGRVLIIETTLEADHNGAFGTRRAECGRILHVFDDSKARDLRVVHVDLTDSRELTPLRRVV